MAWEPIGWEPVWYSEIDPGPCAVLAHHYPRTPNLGDMTKIDGTKHGSAQLLVGGTPCQSFSIAGLRKGLDDDRGNLAFEFLRIARESRPRWLVWENVPGVLSSDGGRNFGAIVGGMAALGYGFAYRILDAQWVRVQSHARAVPQRRRRVFVVGHLGDWRPSAAVLLEQESLQGHPVPRRSRRMDDAGGSEDGAGEHDSRLVGYRHVADVASTLDTVGPGTSNQTVFNTRGALLVGEVLRARTIYEAPPAAGGRTWEWDEMTGTLTGEDRQGPGSVREQHERIGALTTGGGKPGQGYPAARIRTETRDIVRKLTPRECERLQGFPDDFTRVRRPDGKWTTDAQRYMMLGNSVAVNVMSWIGQRIALVEDIMKEDR